MILKSRFVVPIDTAPIENGAIEIQGGRILKVGFATDFGLADTDDFGDAVILPGLINSHTHLELTGLHGRVPPTPDFADWLRRLIEARYLDRSSDARVGSSTESTSETRSTFDQDANSYDAKLRDSVRKAIEMSLAYGVTTVGDITANPEIVRPIFPKYPLNVVSYGEVIALGRDRLALKKRLLAACKSDPSSVRLRLGISPHSPYTLEPQGLRECAEAASRRGWPLCIHVAESREEEEFTRNARGPLADFIAGLGLWDEGIPASGCSPVELLAQSNLLGPRTLLAHANYVSDTDIALIASSRSSVVFCPRTHAAFGHSSHRFREMEQAGVNVCLGTDSLASNPSLSLMDEVRFLYEQDRQLDVHDLLKRITISGAIALGIDKESGSLTPGKWADVIVLPLAPKASGWDEFLDSDTSPIRVYCGGKPAARCESPLL